MTAMEGFLLTWAVVATVVVGFLGAKLRDTAAQIDRHRQRLEAICDRLGVEVPSKVE